MSEVTRILSAIEQGEPLAAEQLLPLVYDELRKLAAYRLAQEQPGQTLDPTALVHEAYLRLVGVDEGRQWNSRGHFFAAAAEAMRRILVDQARHKRSRKAGGGLTDAFVAKLNAAGTAPVFSTYLGGSNEDRGLGIAVDGAGNAFVTGLTYSTIFPTKNPLQAANGGGGDAFVAKISLPAAASRFVIYTPSNVPPGSSFNVTVTARDASGNVATGYSGTIQFTSSAGSTTLPPAYTFTASDQGVHTFTGLVLRTKGKQTLTITDLNDSTIFGTISLDVV